MTADRDTPEDTPGAASRVSYAFARRPKWVVWHLIALAVVITFANLGLWQLRRLAERREHNATVLARGDLPPTPVEALVPSGTSGAEVAELEYRRATAAGTYVTADQVLVRNRTNGGAPGFWVLTPVRLADGTAVVVNRGWIPLPFGDGGDPGAYAPPAGPVVVTGVLHPTQVREGIEAADPAEGRLGVLSRVDLPRFAQQVGYPVRPGYLDLVSSEPSPTVAFPTTLPAPVLDDGPHLNYAGQWFIYTTLTAITYPLLLRHTARRQAETLPALEPTRTAEPV